LPKGLFLFFNNWSQSWFCLQFRSQSIHNVTKISVASYVLRRCSHPLKYICGFHAYKKMREEVNATHYITYLAICKYVAKIFTFSL
jgi:hypothetical protein